MKKLIPFILAIVIIYFGSSCYYDKEELLYPGAATCDTTGTISYTAKVVPILQQQCYSCHSGGSPSGGIQMGTYASDKAIAMNGKLYGTISHSAGYIAMPQGAAKMSDCQIATIKKWIDAGATAN